MKQKIISNNLNAFDKYIIFFVIISQIFFFHIYNQLDKSLILFFFSLSFIFIVKIFLKTFNLYQLEKSSKIFLIILILNFLFKFFFISYHIFFVLDPNMINILSKGNAKYFSYFEAFIYLTSFFYFLFFNFYKRNLFIIFKLSALISIFLMTATIINLTFSNSEEHAGWLNPHIYIFFYNDNVASKLQHAYIVFILFFTFASIIFKKNSIFNEIVITLLFYFILFINSKLFLTITLFILVIFLLLDFTRSNIFKFLRIFFLSLFLFLSSINIIENINDNKKSSYLLNLILKYSFVLNKVLDYENIMNKFNPNVVEKYINAINPNLNEKETTTKMQIYYDSSYSRVDRAKLCLNPTKEIKAYPYSSVIKISSEYKNYGKITEKHINYGENSGRLRYFRINCESAILQSFFENKIIFCINFILIIFLFYYLIIEKKFFILNFLILNIFISIFHLTTANPAFYFFTAYFLGIYNNYKK